MTLSFNERGKGSELQTVVKQSKVIMLQLLIASLVLCSLSNKGELVLSLQ